VELLETNLQTIGQVKTMTFNNDRRASGRKEMGVPGRIIWRDSRGTPRFSSVVTRDVSERATYVECLSGPPIPMHRLVYLQLDRTLHACDFLPAALKQGKVLSAVYRVGSVSNVTGLPDGYALRLLVAPAQRASAVPDPASFANESLALPA
jgi:hypothetical protein